MTAEKILLTLYRTGLMIYPSSFREEFAEEMQDTFIDSWSNAANTGYPAQLILLLREAVDLLPCALQARWNQFWEILDCPKRREILIARWLARSVMLVLLLLIGADFSAAAPTTSLEAVFRSWQIMAVSGILLSFVWERLSGWILIATGIIVFVFIVTLIFMLNMAHLAIVSAIIWTVPFLMCGRLMLAIDRKNRNLKQGA